MEIRAKLVVATTALVLLFVYLNLYVSLHLDVHIRPLYDRASAWTLNQVRSSAAEEPRFKRTQLHLVNFKLPEEELKTRKTILLATKYWKNKYGGLGAAKTVCPRCVYTEDVTNWNRSDAIVFHMFDLDKNTPPKKPRTSNQIWILSNWESANSRNWSLEHLKKYDNLFNWTMSYRLDSEVYAPSGQIVSNEDYPDPHPGGSSSSGTGSMRYGIPTLDELQNKSMAAWIVSECQSHGKREELVAKLQEHVSVDIYGDCGPHKCDSNRNYSAKRSDCKRKLSTRYKFYMALENSVCQDYVSEKFFEALQNPIVPIVYGGANYSAIAPKYSYINARDFETVEALADHLIWLDENPLEYLKYFEWKRTYWLAPVHRFCTICDALWEQPDDDDDGHKTLRSAYDWMYKRSDGLLDADGQVQPACVQPSEISFK